MLIGSLGIFLCCFTLSNLIISFLGESERERERERERDKEKERERERAHDKY